MTPATEKKRMLTVLVWLQCYSRLLFQLSGDQELSASHGGAQASQEAEQVQEIADEPGQQHQQSDCEESGKCKD